MVRYRIRDQPDPDGSYRIEVIDRIQTTKPHLDYDRELEGTASYIVFKDPFNVVYAVEVSSGKIISHGLDATTVIQQAIDAVYNAGGGGDVVLKEGEFTLNDTVYVKNNVELIGLKNTVIKGSVDPLIQAEGVGVFSIKGITFEHLERKTALYLHDSYDFVVEKCRFINAMVSVRNSWRFWIRDNYFYNAKYKDMTLLYITHTSNAFHVVDNIFNGWKKGIVISDDADVEDGCFDFEIKGNILVDGGEMGIQIYGEPHHFNIESNHVHGADYGYVIQKKDVANPSYVTFIGNSIRACVRGLVTNNVDALLLDNNNLQDASFYSYSFTATTFLKNSGTATISAGSTSVTVSHGLVATPSKVLVTPIGDPGDRFWVANVGSSSFDIVVATAPGADIDFYWYAEV